MHAVYDRCVIKQSGSSSRAARITQRGVRMGSNKSQHARTRTLVEKWKIHLGNWCHPFVRKEEAIKRLGIYSRAENKGSRRDAKQESVRVADKKSPLSRSCVRSSACEMQHAFIYAQVRGSRIRSSRQIDEWAEITAPPSARYLDLFSCQSLGNAY